VEKDVAWRVVMLADPLIDLSESALRFSGICTDVSDAHLPNVSCSSLSINGGSVTDVKLEQFMKTRSPR